MNTLKDYVDWKLTHAQKIAEAEGYPLTMENCKANKRMKELLVYGNSMQDGTPTPETPIDVVSVGELVTDETDDNYGKYKIPLLIKTSLQTYSTNIFLNEPLRKIGDYADYIEFKSGKVIRNVLKTNLASINFIEKSTMSTSNHFIAYDVNTVSNVDMRTGQDCWSVVPCVFCTKLKPILWSELRSSKVAYGITTTINSSGYNEVRLCIPEEKASTLTKFKEWQNSNDCDVYFARITPVEEDISLDLPKLKSKMSIIEADTSLPPSSIYGKYIKR